MLPGCGHWTQQERAREVNDAMLPWTPGSPSITRPRRHNGMPYRGINVLLLWARRSTAAIGARLDDLLPSSRARRACPARRAGQDCRLRRPVKHSDDCDP
jgi:hypothetical protein